MLRHVVIIRNLHESVVEGADSHQHCGGNYSIVVAMGKSLLFFTLIDPIFGNIIMTSLPPTDVCGLVYYIKMYVGFYRTNVF